MTWQNVSSSGALQTDAVNLTVPEGCLPVRFSESDAPASNTSSGGIVSVDVQFFTAKLRTNLLMILFLIGGPANVINMAVFFKQGLKDRVNLLLFSLSLADELCLITYVIHFFEEFYLQFTGYKGMGPVFIILLNNLFTGFHAFGFVSFVLSAIIACERCCCVMWPLRYPTLMRTGTLAAIIVAVYVIVMGLYFIVVSKYYLACVYDTDSGAVSYVSVRSEFYQRYEAVIDYIDNIVFGVGLPSGMSLVVVTATAITITKLRQALAWRTETATSVSAKEVALTKTLVGTSGLLIVCIFPSCLLRLSSLVVPEMNAGNRYQTLFFTCHQISHIFIFVNCTFNVFIYYVMGSRYRETFWALFKRRTQQIESGK